MANHRRGTPTGVALSIAESQGQRLEQRRGLIARASVAVVNIAAAACFSVLSIDAAAAGKSKAPPDPSKAAIAHAHEVVEARLKDPSSVQYRDEKFVPEKSAVCGQYNAKNSFGGYVGFRFYMVDADGLHELKSVPEIEAENRRTGEGELNIIARAKADSAAMRAACVQQSAAQ